MAETRVRQVQWTVKNEYILIAKHCDRYGNPIDELKQEFDVREYWTVWDSFDEVQKHGAIYTIKQKLSDKKSKNKDARLASTERHTLFAEFWKQLTVDREWKSPTVAVERLTKKATRSQLDSINARIESGELSDPIEIATAINEAMAELKL